MIKIKRHKYLVDKVFQFRYMALLVFPLIILLAALHYLIYYSVFSQMLVPEAVSVTLLPAMKRANLVIAIIFPILLFFIIRMALIYSNRVIGPIPRLERELDKAISGDYSARLKTRDKDELKSFVGKVNVLLEKIDKENKA